MTHPIQPEPPGKMTSAEFLGWAAREDVGRVELIDGEVVAMASESVRHSVAKQNVFLALSSASQSQKPDCCAFVDGPSVVVDEQTTFIPDVVLQCGSVEDFDAVALTTPTVVVEVLSPGSWRNDLSNKLYHYFRVASIAHYLLVDAADRRVIHHARGGEGRIDTRIAVNGSLTLDPPGLTVDITDFWRGLPED